MSTKTSFKRIALVAASALAIAGFSAVPANAVDAADATPFFISVADTGVQTAVAATGSATAIAGADNYVGFEIGADGVGFADLAANTKLTLTTSGAGSSIKAAVTTNTWTYNNATAPAGTLATAISSPAAEADGDLAGDIVHVATPTAGTVTVTVSRDALNTATGVTTKTTLQVFTITVGAASVVGTISAGNSTSYITDTSTLVDEVSATTLVTDARAALPTADSIVYASKTAAATVGTSAAKAVIAVTLKDTQSTPAPIAGKTLTATITGPGLIAGTGTGTTTLGTALSSASSVTASSTGVAIFAIYSSGASGVATITITETSATTGVTTTIATETVTFYGSTSTLTAAGLYTNIPSSGSAYPASLTATAHVAKITAKDSAGNPVASAAITGKAADTTLISAVTCGSTGATGFVYCSATGVAGKSGTTTVTFTYGSAATFDLATTTLDVTVSSVKAATFVISAEPEVSAGQLITYTITAKDSNGLPIPDGSLATDYMVASTPVISGGAMVDNGGNANAVNALFTGVKFSGGVATDAVQAPFGMTTITAAFENVGDGLLTTSGGTYFATAAAGNATTTLTTEVTTADPTASLALDAANAATDAANNAYDEAQNATQAASDALAAVTALAKQVKTLIASVKKLTAAVAKLR